MTVAATVVVLLFGAVLLALVSNLRREHRRLTALELRLRTLEADAATTIVFEPPPASRLPHEQLN